MASSSHTSIHPQLEESTPSTSASPRSSSMPALVRYKPPTIKLAFQNDKIYHVFLSFRGKDVRRTLVDHLFEALSAAGLNVFLDSHKLKKGEIIDSTLETAINGSAIRIPIFSESYADSAWCLKEAAAMLNTTDLIIPLFYHVEPTHVRYPEGNDSPYKQSFLKHESHPDRYTEKEVKGWKDALEEICKRSGWSTDLTGHFEAGLVKMVVNDVVQTLDRVPLEVAQHPVGLDSVKNALIQKLNLTSENEVVKVGICGIGGIGKSTVARAVYNQIYDRFDAASFVSDVGTTAAENSAPVLIKLQKIVLRDLCEYYGKVDNVAKGKALFTDRLSGKRVLLILDDVATDEQLNALVGGWLAPGSRVIITSRDEHILNVARVPSEYIHAVNGLDINEGLRLFSWHAFLRASPDTSYEDLSRKIVEACMGHPLSLGVIGSSLYDKKNDRDRGCWEEARDNITLIQKIHDVLYISYRGLSDEEKEIFIDIACCFIGEQEKFPIVFWKSLQYKMVDTALCNLSMKLLIKIADRGLFGMHDHLRDMGRIIAEKEKDGNRRWEAAHLRKIDFIRLTVNEGNPQRLHMIYRHDLRYLHLQNVTIEDMTENTLPSSLIWLKLEDCTFATGKYRAIKKILAAIREQGHSTPADNSWQLKIMQLKGCSNLDSIPISSLFSFPCVQLLQHLDLERCRGLDYLPDTICRLSQLQTLNLAWWDMLNELPPKIGNLSQLQHLDLKGCGSLNNLPPSIGGLSHLEYLNLEMCYNLKNLPDAIGDLLQLKHLNLEACFNFKDLPHSIGALSQLQHLNLKMCYTLNNLPETIGNLSQLQHLDLEGCASLTDLPGTIRNLSQLQYFTKPSNMAKRAIQSRSRYHEYMPPTTKLAFQTNKMYHVFLSFRGPDVRNTLVDHLYQALSVAGLNVFLDTSKLEEGEVIELSLETVIERSAIRIPIFSKGYANSAWCLKEAASMLKSPGLIIPLFYDVDQMDVRYPLKNSSQYKQSFLKHYSHSDQYPREEIEWWKSVLKHICPCLNFGGHSVRYPRREIDSWKDALREISSRPGWSMDITQGFEARLVRTVVNDLVKTFNRVPFEIAKHSVGLESVKNALIHKLNLNSVDDVIKIGIWGVAGIGKTTVAKALYNQVYMEFEAVSYVFNISATAADETGLIRLQREVLRDLCKYDGEVYSVLQGKSLFKDRLRGKLVLLVLDGVDAMVQLDALAGDWLTPGSRVIITSRDINILNVANISSECIHEMSGLETNEALQLFSWHAF